MPELKPCPFCGNKEIEVVQVSEEAAAAGCEHCNLCLFTFDKGENIKEKWNAACPYEISG